MKTALVQLKEMLSYENWHEGKPPDIEASTYSGWSKFKLTRSGILVVFFNVAVVRDLSKHNLYLHRYDFFSCGKSPAVFSVYMPKDASPIERII